MIDRAVAEGVLIQYQGRIEGDLREEYESAAPRLDAPLSRAEIVTHGDAVRQLQSRHDDLKRGKFWMAFDDDELRQRAKLCANRVAFMFGDRWAAEAFCESRGIVPPDCESDEGAIARMRCEMWWRRRFRVAYSRRSEAVLRDVGRVCRRKDIYASHEAVERVKAAHGRCRSMLGEMVAQSDEGDEIDLLSVVDGSLANPSVRFAEMMTRARGFERIANEVGHVGLMLTFTTPSRFHRTHSSGERNDRSDGSTPRDGQQWLCKMWQRIRAKLKRDGIEVYGLRVAEPHHDGTPHWHLMLFCEPGKARQVELISARYLLSDCGSEPGAAKHRFQSVRVDKSKGSATGYLIKYIAKNIDGRGVGDDYENDALATDTAEHVRAWASTWGIRQFQQIGGAPVGVWRELRRMRDPVESPVIEVARQAADAGRWDLFLKAMRANPVRLLKVYSDESNRYGEPIGDRIRGVVAGLVEIVTRSKAWKIVFSVDGAPWTRVNNCTRRDEHHPAEFLQYAALAPPEWSLSG